MKRKVLFLFIAISAISILAVANVITVKFIGKNADDNRYVQLDSIAIENLTKNWRQVAVFPDTLIDLSVSTTTEIPEIKIPAFGIADLAPNPAEGVAYFNLSVPESGKISLTLTDVSGHALLNAEENMQAGVFAYRLTMQITGTYIVRATNGKEISVAKVINRGSAGEMSLTQIAKIEAPKTVRKVAKLPQNEFETSDEMRYTGFATVGDCLYASDQISQNQTADETVELIFHLCETIETEFSETACDEYFWNEIRLTKSGDYKQTFKSVNGCDSIVTLHLTINKYVSTILNDTICFGETYQENGFNGSVTGSYWHLLRACLCHLRIWHSLRRTKKV